MLKTFMTATAIGGLMVSTAFAQAPAPQRPAQPPAATQPAQPPAATPPAGQAQAPAAQGPQFLATQSNDQFLATRFRGTDVIGPNNQKVGDVNDVLFDSKGRVVGIVVGVGGFLGIGQKDVAIDLAAFEIVPPDTDRNATTGTATPAPAPTAAPAGGQGMTGTVADPNNIKLRVSWTKEQLEQAPSFERYRAPATTGGATRPMGGGGTAPTR
jgi:septal ring-binding cell division protein DamX